MSTKNFRASEKDYLERTLQQRVRDKHAKWLLEQARAVNFVWNYDNEARLRWRVSDPKRANYSLGWVPFKKSAIAYRSGQMRFMGVPLGLWDSYGLSEYELGPGCFSEDARGRWYST